MKTVGVLFAFVACALCAATVAPAAPPSQLPDVAEKLLLGTPPRFAPRVAHCAPYVAPVVYAPAVSYYEPERVRVYATYGPAPETADLAGAIKLLVEDNRQMRQDLIQALKGGPLSLREAAPDPGAIHLRRDCAKCHDESVAKSKGKGYTFFRGGEFLDEGDNLAMCLEAIKADRMPKDQKWSFQQKYEAHGYLTLKPAAPLEKLESKLPPKLEK